MKLNVLERLLLLNNLPREGDFTSLKIVRDLQNSLSFSEAEHKKYQFKQEKGKVRWNVGVDQNKEISIGEKANGIIVDTLKKLNKDKKLTMEHLDLYEKFIKEE